MFIHMLGCACIGRDYSSEATCLLLLVALVHCDVVAINIVAIHETTSPSHRRGTLKGVPIVKSPRVTLKSLLSHLKVTFSWNHF